MKLTPIISGILIVTGLCLAGASAQDFGRQVIINAVGIGALGAGCLIMTITQNDRL